VGNYYYLVSSLPPLELGKRPDITFEELIARLEVNARAKDLEQVKVLRRLYDIENIRYLLMEEPLDPRGNLDEKELDQALLVRDAFADYIFDFWDSFSTTEERLAHFWGFFARFFQEETPQTTGFLKSYLTLEREWRMVALALRAKELGRDLVFELQFEDPTDPFVARILAQKDAPTFDPPPEYAALRAIYEATRDDPWRRYVEFAAFRMQRIQELVDRPLFDFDWVLAYMTQLFIVEQELELDGERGRRILDNFKAG
jgi:hypothetical protein